MHTARTNGMFIVNGHRGPESSKAKRIGNETQGNSVIDYCLASYETGKNIRKMQVIPHNKEVSDHCCIRIKVEPTEQGEQSSEHLDIRKLVKTLSQVNHDYEQNFLSALNTSKSVKRKNNRQPVLAGTQFEAKPIYDRLINDRNAIWRFVSKEISSNNQPPLEEYRNHMEKVLFDTQKEPTAIPDKLTNLESESGPQLPPGKLLDAVTDDEVRETLQEMNWSSTPGKDGVTYRKLAQEIETLAPFLAKWYSHIIFSGHYPNSWKEAVISPIYKKGNSTVPSNYRPITLQPCVAKLFSKIIEKRMRIWLCEHNPLRPEQFGFQKNTSTIDAAFTLKTGIAAEIADQRKVFVTMVDFSTAFDSIDTTILLERLRNKGLPLKLLKIIANMYHLCQATVKTNEGYSKSLSINKGVKQGDPLSPLLFCL